MLWSKIWFSLVAAAGALAVALAFLAPQPIVRDLEGEMGARLERAQHSASLLLRLNARKWIDSAAQVATDAVLVESLEQATKGAADLGLVHKTVQERLHYFSERMKVDLVVATDARGRVIARAGIDEAIYKDGVEGFPLVADALRGLRGDDTWSLGGKLYRVAASPVIVRDRYAGALIVGQEVGSELAQSMKGVLQVDVAFLLRGRVLAASAPLSILSRMPVLVDQHAAELAEGGRSAALRITEGQDGYLVVLAPFTGEAAEHRAAYALISPRPQVGTIQELVAGIAGTDLRTLPWRQLWPIGGALIGVLLFGFLFMRLEAERPLRRLAREAQALARGEAPRLDDHRHPGRFGTVARAVNTTLDRLGSSARLSSSSVKSSDPALRSPTPLPPPPIRLQSQPAAPALMFQPGPTMEATFDAGPVERPAPDGGPTSDFEGRLTLEHNPWPPPPLPGAKRPTGERPAMSDKGAPALQSLGSDTEPHETGPDYIAGTTPVHKHATQRPASGLKPPPRPPGLTLLGAGKPFEEPTTVESPSEELLRKSNPRGRLNDEDPLELEFRNVFQEFLATKQRCGESIEGVTYDRFSVKLRSNRDQLITRYSCKTVRFQVYVKDGKAALKATPVTG
jgi:hypothetical protein